MSNTASATKITTGKVINQRTLVTAASEKVDIPDAKRLVHIQFLRFAGCAFCNVQLRSFERRYNEITTAGIREVVVFRSTAEQLQRHHGDVPFDMVLDPEGTLYDEFGVGSGLRAVLNPHTLLMALPNLIRKFPTGPGLPPPGQRFKGVFGFPADFLIGTDGRVVACKYGASADDHWSVDELVSLARQHGS
jgi:peroxiredoxin